MLQLGLKACKTIVAIGGAIASIETLHTYVWPFIQAVGSSVFPESFWYGGLDIAKSERSKRKAMKILETQLQDAHNKEDYLMWKISTYSEKEKRKLESTFRKVIREAERLRDN